MEIVNFHREDCKHIAYLYENDRTYFDKAKCLKRLFPTKWYCSENCPDFEKNPYYYVEEGNTCPE